jgi:hypothetical protein
MRHNLAVKLTGRLREQEDAVCSSYRGSVVKVLGRPAAYLYRVMRLGPDLTSPVSLPAYKRHAS